MAPAKPRAIAIGRGISDRYLVLAIGLLLLCIVAALVSRPHRSTVWQRASTIELRTTCSAERDCFVAPAESARISARALDTTVASYDAPAVQDHGSADHARDGVAADSTAAFGSLVVPSSAWSSPAARPTMTEDLRPASRLSAVVAAAGQPKHLANGRNPRQKPPVRGGADAPRR